MTEIEKIAYAKSFVDKMAQGINPLDDTPIPEGDILNHVRLARCMFYVSDILGQVIDNGGVTAPAKKTKKLKKPFALTAEQLSGFVISPTPISASELAHKLNDLADDEQMERLTYKRLSDWLVKLGVLCERANADGKIKKYPTDIGNRLGIHCERRESVHGVYEVVVYDAHAQQFVLDNLPALTDEYLTNERSAEK